MTLNANNNGNPGDVLCTLTNPASFTSEAVHVFNAPTTGCPTIAASIAYFVVIERVNSTSHAIRLDFTTSTDEDSAGAAGWSIFNGSQKLQSGQSWVKDTLSTYMIEVSGYAEELPIVVEKLPPGVEPDPPPPAIPEKGEIPVDWALKPSGLEAGDRFRLLFLSSTTRNAESTDIADYNGFVQDLTAAGHADIQPYSSQFRAVACTSAVDAIDNTRTTGTGVPIYWLDGAKAADNYADFYDGSWDQETTVRNESGTTISIPFASSTYAVWAGCEHDGTEGTETSGNSLALGTTQPGVGQLNSVVNADNGPLDYTETKDPKADLNYLYGLSPVFVVMPPSRVISADWGLAPPGLEAGDRFRLLFLSSTDRNAESTNIEDYNNFVQDLTAAGHADIQPYSSQFRAVACTSAIDAIDNTRTTGTGVPIYWLNGSKAADHNADFYDGSWDETVNVSNESGTAVTIPLTSSTYLAWTGCEDDGTEAVTSGDSHALGTTNPQVGQLNSIQTNTPLHQGGDPKANLNHLYSLSPVFVIKPPSRIVPIDWSIAPSGLEAGEQFRILFISSTERNAKSTDIADYNNFVQDLAATGHSDIQAYSSQFRAVACTSAIDAIDNTRTTGTGVPIYWLNGSKAADHNADFYDGSWDEETNVRNESGTAVTIPFSSNQYAVWAGCEHDGTEGTDTGGNSLALGTTQPGFGQLNSVINADNGPLDYTETKDPKANLHYVYGLSPIFVSREVTIEKLPPGVEPAQPPVILLKREIPIDWDLAPSGLEAGDRFRLMFLSSTERKAESTDIGDYNGFVQGLAAAGHTDIRPYNSQFRAVACTEAVDAINNTGTTGTGVPIYWLDGAKAADNYADFYDGSWDQEASVRNESGTAVTVSFANIENNVWSGCEHDGTEAFHSGDSIALGTDGPGVGQLNGLTTSEIGPLNLTGSRNLPATENYLYGLSPVFVVMPPPLEVPADWDLAPSGLEAGDRFRLLFLSSTDRNAESTNISDYNNFVQDLAATGHSDVQAYSSQFRAVACTEAVDARDNTGTTGTGVPIYWLDGAKAADHNTDFYDGSWDQEASVRNESGTAVTVSFANIENNVWSGCEHDGTEAFHSGDSIALGTDGPGVGQLNGLTTSEIGPLNLTGSRNLPATENYLYGLSPVFVVMPPSRIIPLDWSLAPPGLEVGDRFRLLFLSSTDRNAESTDISDYNGFVHDLAAAGHTDIQPYNSQFRAVACTEAVDAINNTGTTGTGVPIYWLGGAKAADHNTDFYDGSWDQEASVRNESGTTITVSFANIENNVWSGCEHDGTEAFHSGDSIALGTDGPGVGQLNGLTTSDIGPLNLTGSRNLPATENYLYGLSPVFVTGATTKPTSPTTLTAEPAPDATPQLAIDLSWTAPSSDGGSAITKHQYRFKTGSTASGVFGAWTDIPASAAGQTNATSYTVNSIAATTPPIDFTFEVQAVNDIDASGESNQANATIDVPDEIATLGTTEGDRQVDLVWDTPDNNGSAILNYQYYVRVDGTNSYPVALDTNIADSIADTTGFTVTGLANSTTYIIGVRAVNSAGPGSYTSEGNITPRIDPNAPDVQVAFEHESHSLSEGSSVTISVRLNADPKRTVVVPITKTNENGASSDDYSGVPSRVTFRTRDTLRSFTFTAAQDATDDDGESVRLGFGTLPAKVTAGTTNQVTISIADHGEFTGNRPPTVSATANPRTVYAGEMVTLDGVANDPDDDVLTYAWTSNSGGTFIPGPTLLDTNWVPPATEATITAALTLTVTDERGLNSSVTVTVVVQPPPAPNPATGLDGHVSDDNVVSLTWTIPNQPSLITLDNVLVQQRMSGGQFSAPVWETIATLPPSTTAHTFNGLDREHNLPFPHTPDQHDQHLRRFRTRRRQNPQDSSSATPLRYCLADANQHHPQLVQYSKPPPNTSSSPVKTVTPTGPESLAPSTIYPAAQTTVTLSP